MNITTHFHSKHCTQVWCIVRRYVFLLVKSKRVFWIVKIVCNLNTLYPLIVSTI